MIFMSVTVVKKVILKSLGGFIVVAISLIINPKAISSFLFSSILVILVFWPFMVLLKDGCNNFYFGHDDHYVVATLCLGEVRIHACVILW